jgi:glycosyltransferase involved in cell wall biosynthesis
MYHFRPVRRKEQKINILYIIDELNIGGTENQLLTTIESLNRDRFTPHLVCLRKSQHYTRCNIDCRKHALGVTSLCSLNGLRKLLQLVLYLKKNKIDIVQTYFFDSNLFGVLAARLAFVKKVISCRRDMGFWYSSGLVQILKCINICVNNFLVNSFAIKENLISVESVPARKIKVIYNGVSLKKFNKGFNNDKIKKDLGINADDFVVGIVANLNRSVKRVDVFLRAAKDVLEKTLNVSFVIIGGGKLAKELKSLADSLGVQDKVFFAGLQKDISQFLLIFDIGVLSSESEGFSNSILEYMASGLPVICTDSGGSSELVENEKNGYLVKVCDHQEMAAKILVILGDSELKQMMSTANQQRIKNFAWPKIITSIESYYYSMILDQK